MHHLLGDCKMLLLNSLGAGDLQGILEQARRKKIARLTDLCDKLLERGVLVYESTREQLAIEVCCSKHGYQ